MYRPGAVGALLDIYEQAIADLKKTIEDIPNHALTIITDPHTDDENCRSIQTILSHVVSSGYGYATSIHNLKGHSLQRPEKTFHITIQAYMEDLTRVFAYTENVFQEIKDQELEQFDSALKIKTGWGQLYDIEQLTEHAIVHILRHKRQIEKMKRNKYYTQNSNNMITILRTNSENKDFVELVRHLDQDLKIRDGEEHAFYNQFNKIDQIKHVLVACLNESPVGCGAIRAYDEKTMEVKRMFVFPELRGQGIATTILTELENWARELGYDRCILETGKKQPEAIALYQKNGYQLIPSYGQYKNVENSVCFEKKL